MEIGDKTLKDYPSHSVMRPNQEQSSCNLCIAGPSMNQQQLVGMQRAEFENASRLMAWMIVIQAAIIVVSLVGASASDTSVVYGSTIALLALTGLWLWTCYCYQSSRGGAEQARHATLIMEGLGEQISAQELRDLESQLTVSRDRGRKFEDPNYFSSLARPGDARFARMLEQSAFFTFHLMKRSAGITWSVVIIILCAAFLLAVSLAPILPAQQHQDALRLFCVLLTMFVSSNIFLAAVAYTRSALTIKHLLVRLGAFNVDDHPRADLLLMFADYNSAVESAPMLLPGLYSRSRDDLNARWTEYDQRVNGGA